MKPPDEEWLNGNRALKGYFYTEMILKVPINTMLFLGLPRNSWQKYYFESLQDIKSDQKGFVEWSKKQTKQTQNP